MQQNLTFNLKTRTQTKSDSVGNTRKAITSSMSTTSVSVTLQGNWIAKTLDILHIHLDNIQTKSLSADLSIP